MEIFAKISMAILLSFVIAIIISPFLIKLAKKIKFNQPVYEYVDMHKKKSGTATMGGLIFIFAIVIASFIMFFGENNLSMVVMCIIITVSYGLIGFLDDFLKIKFQHNEGLKPYQKIIGQFIIAIIIAVYAYQSRYVMGEMYIPFTTKTIDIGIWYVPFVVIFFIAITNSVNLTDGLDGLAGGVTLNYLITFLIIFLIIFFSFSQHQISSTPLLKEYTNIIIFVSIGIGSILAYLLYNSHPAIIFMGDTGSLALGGLLGSLAIFTKTILYVPFVAVMFIVSSLSVIIQVTYYKLTHKRVFLMAPYHHHLEKKSMYETKIVTIYMIITAVMGILSILLTLCFIE